jgi:CheY-like chemotaxis protein
VNGSSLPPLRLLLAEDNDNSFRLFMSYVKAAGHTVSRVLNGAEAVEMAKHGDYDLIVMDVNMPRLDGYAATRLIREWETEQGRARLPILLLSADDLERQVRLGGAAGCSGHLTKPTTKAQVLAALNYYAHAPLKDLDPGGRGSFFA